MSDTFPGDGSGALDPSEDGAAENELRLWLVVRRDIDIPRPKFGVQTAHAAAACLWLAKDLIPDVCATYMEASQAKIVLAAKTEHALVRAWTEARTAGLPAVIIRDAGRTVFAGPTLTAVGIGPCRRDELPPFVQKLQLLNA